MKWSYFILFVEGAKKDYLKNTQTRTGAPSNVSTVWGHASRTGRIF
jgi:hypothetical protein